MFDKITLRRSEAGSHLTAGDLAEALLFYQNTHLVLDQSALLTLGQTIGVPTLLGLLSRQNVSATYCDQSAVTMTRSLGGVQYHDFATVSLVDKNARRGGSVTERLEYIMMDKLGHGRRDSRRYSRMFRERVPVRSFAGDDFLAGGILNAAREDLLEQAFVLKCIRTILDVLVHTEALPQVNRFDVSKMRDGFVVDTDLDCTTLNFLGFERITPAFLLDAILTARVDLALAAHYGGDLHTWELTSEIVGLRHKELLRRIGLDKGQLAAFMEVVVPEGRTIREAVDTGERSFEEFLGVLDRAEKFKNWIRGVNPDEHIVAAYLRDVTSEGWINSLPTKAIRYVFSFAAGLLEPITGTALSAGDAFLLERLVGGWRPNHFVDTRLKPFVGET